MIVVASALDSSKHFTEQNLISILNTGEQKARWLPIASFLTALHEQEIADIKTATVESYESLRDVYSLFRTLSTSARAAFKCS